MTKAQENTTRSLPVETPFRALGKVNFPSDIKNLDLNGLNELCDDVRRFMIASVAKTGGHLGAGLGVVELTIALHTVFDTPRDRIVWDVGHQTYPHKIVTGRKDKMNTLRQGGGLSGFTKRSESEYDPFGAAHSSTSISAALGMAVARDLDGEDNHVIAVIGDGAMSAGMAYEAMNNAGIQTINDKKCKLIVILNDNEMSIAPPVGAMSRHLTRIVSSKPYIGAREFGKRVTEILPTPIRHALKRAEESGRTVMGGGTLFEEMGFYYIGPVDGHNLEELTAILRNVKDSQHEGPVLIHVMTQKGKGYLPAENAQDKMHGVKKFDVITGTQAKSKIEAPAYTKVFADTLIKLAEKDPKILAITAAMPSGTGIDAFSHAFPERSFDVGIAEQHAVTFAAGLSTEGYKPFVSIYSTFLQRAYDQVVHDVALQNLPVRFILDRAGLVGADGQTHAGAFDLAYLGCLPNFVIMSPSDEAELANMVATAAEHDSSPIAIRFPRGEGIGTQMPDTPEILKIGKGRIVKKGKKIAVLSLGTRLEECLKAAGILQEKLDFDITVADARFAKPIDEDLVKSLAQNHDVLITVEEGSRGGFGAHVLHYLAEAALLDKGLKVRTMTLPDHFQDQDTPFAQYDEAQLNAIHIAKLACSLL